MQQLDKLGFLNQGFMFWLVCCYICTITNLACRMGIKLIIYAEDGEIEYGGKRYLDKKMLLMLASNQDFWGGYYDYIKKLKQLLQKCFYKYPPQKMLKDIKYVSLIFTLGII